jgi:hypothetical protein
LIEKRGKIKASLMEFKIFLDTHGETTSIESLQERFHRNEPLINEFERVQYQIDALVVRTAEEEVHTQ